MNIGIKYYKYNSDKELEVYRIIKKNDDDSFNLKCGKIIVMNVTKDVLNNDYIMLTPDYMMNVFSTNLKIEDGINKEDVYVAVHKMNDVNSKSNEPILVLRQDIYSLSKNFDPNNFSTIYVGECFTEDKLSGNETMGGLFEFTEIVDSAQVYLYLDDKFNTIYNLIPKDVVNKIDKTLENMSRKGSTGVIKGYARSLKELFIENNFMLNFRKTANIFQLDFPIFITNEKRNEDGSVNLNQRQHKRLEDALRQHIQIIKIIEYDKDIDISKIVKYNHVIVSDSEDRLFFIAYAKISDYPIDNDIASALGLI